MKKLVIIGASGHGKVVADIAKKCGYGAIVFLDDDEKLIDTGIYIPTFVHLDAVIAKDVESGPATVVMAGAVINPGSRIGAGVTVIKDIGEAGTYVGVPVAMPDRTNVREGGNFSLKINLGRYILCPLKGGVCDA